MIATVRDAETSPPRVLQLAGHPLRWRLLTELAHSDRRVGELCHLAHQRQSLVSYHLRKLRDGGLVSMRRSDNDGRDAYYAIDLARCDELLSSAGAALHPGLTPTRRRPRRRARPELARVLFLCTGNSSRSQIAEAVAAELLGRRDQRRQRREPPQAAAPERGAGDGRAWRRSLRASFQALG